MATCKVVTEKELTLEYGETPESIEEIKRLAEDTEAFDRKTCENGEVGSQAFCELVDAYLEA